MAFTNSDLTKHSDTYEKQPILHLVAPLVLASASPRRKELLDQIHLPFSVASIDIDESIIPHESPIDYVSRLAEQKARALRSSNIKFAESIVIAADTTVCVNGHILTKPTDKSDAIRMWQLLSNNTHQVYTGVCILFKNDKDIFYVQTDVTFKTLTTSEMHHYWASGEPQGKAGSYAIQGLGAAWIKSITGSYSNVVGLPLFETIQSLRTLSF